MIDPVSSIDVAEKLVHIFGIPAITGVVIWLIRQYDATQRAFLDLHENTKLAVSTVKEVKSSVDLMQTNHLAHIAEDIKSLHLAEDQTVAVLTSIDKGIAVLVDRSRL